MLWLKIFHIAAVVFWFAGLLYLPRLFVYHAAAEDKIGRERFCQMEAKLYWRIMMPSMVAAIGFGLALLPYHQGQWIMAKLLLVFLLLLYHLYCGVVIRHFAADRTPHQARFFRWFNEVPALLLLIIVWLVVAKPF